MIIKHPTPDLIPSLKALWREAFDDGDFSEVFFGTAFEVDHSIVATEEEDVLGALYFLDFEYNGAPAAYIYAVATAKKHRGRGVCRALMDECHRVLKARGYGFAFLRPGNERLFEFYGKLGYEVCGGVSTVTAEACGSVAIRECDAEEYAAMRSEMLPQSGAKISEKGLDFAAGYMRFYAGDGFGFSAYTEDGELYCGEIFGDDPPLPEIVGALGCRRGRFRLAGDEPFIMGYPLCGDLPKGMLFTLVFD